MDPLLILGLLIACGYFLACAVWPFTACRRCDGTGRRVRLGRVLWELGKRDDRT